MEYSTGDIRLYTYMYMYELCIHVMAYGCFRRLVEPANKKRSSIIHVHVHVQYSNAHVQYSNVHVQYSNECTCR